VVVTWLSHEFLNFSDLEMRLGFLGRGDAVTEATSRGPTSIRGQGAGSHHGVYQKKITKRQKPEAAITV
jgi:hypothetical protein